jgi:diacylglycerol O-acyltransferase
MRRLTGTDSLFLTIETPSWHQHVGALIVLEPGDSPVTFEAVAASMDSRLDWAPKLRWKLATMPLGLDVPCWIDDEEFDISRHVRRIGVPSPGGFRETAEVAGRIMSSQLDRSRPLWELWFLEGLSDGRVATVMKYHHCLLDGISGASLATLLMDLDPDSDGPLLPRPPVAEQKAGPAPSSVEMAVQLARRAAGGPMRVPRYLVGGARKISSAAAEYRRGDQQQGMLRAPATSFNKTIGPDRALSFASVPLDDVKQLKAKHDVKVNDVLLALVAGALHTYLVETGGAPDASLTAGVPISTRSEGDSTLDNQVSTMFVSLGTDIADPVERLRVIQASTATGKALSKAMSGHHIQSLGDVVSPLVLSAAVTALYRAGLASRGGAVVNTTVSNVPGPPVPLYMCGAKVTGMFPCSIIMEGMGINCTVISYVDRVDFGFIVDPALVPDPWRVASGITSALAELKEASDLGPVTPIKTAFGGLS